MHTAWAHKQSQNPEPHRAGRDIPLEDSQRDDHGGRDRGGGVRDGGGTLKGGEEMYRIDYAGGRCSNFAHSRTDLLDWLKILKDETITDIRRLYKSGVSDSVLEKYQSYINKMSPSVGADKARG